ncbi:hypothetical protein Pelo_1345 [Pelomyxa schiedti]|nr:hypothetical protein Pelo_1345 [Pelomyxa schiedti]
MSSCGALRVPVEEQDEEYIALRIIRLFSEDSYTEAHDICTKIVSIYETEQPFLAQTRLALLACLVIRFIFPTHPELFPHSGVSRDHVMLPWLFDRLLSQATMYPAESHSFVQGVLLKVCNYGEPELGCGSEQTQQQEQPIPPQGGKNAESYPDTMKSFAHFLYGFLHQTGVGVVKDYTVANAHFEQATTPPCSRLAQYYLARNYFTGDGFPQDPHQAERLLRELAEQSGTRSCASSPMAWRSLGVTYQTGKLGHKDLPRSLQCYLAASRYGWANAQYEVGVAYKRGWTGPPDHRQALGWFHLAGEQGLDVALCGIGQYRESGSGDGAVQRDRREAVRWYRLAGNQNYKPAVYRLGSALSFSGAVSD